MLYVICGVSSFFIAMLASSLGLGGGFLFIPMFTWLGMDYKHEVIPTVLILNLVISLTAQTSYLKKRITNVKVALIMACAAIIFAQFGAFINRYLPTDSLKLAFSFIVFTAAMDIIFFSKPVRERDYKGLDVNILPVLAAGAVAGTMSGLLGIGGGFIMVPILLFMGLPTKRAAATSSMVVFFSSTSAFLGHIKTQHIDLILAAACIAAVAIGAKTGSLLMAEKFRSRYIRKALGVIMIFVAIKFFLESI